MGIVFVYFLEDFQIGRGKTEKFYAPDLRTCLQQGTVRPPGDYKPLTYEPVYKVLYDLLAIISP